MIEHLMRSVSVIALSASLAMPSPILAQSDSGAADETPAAETCPDGSEPVAREGSDSPVCPSEAPAQDEAAAEPAAEAPAEDAAAGEEVPAAPEGDAAGSDAATAETEAPPAEVPAAGSETATTEEPAAESETAATEEPAAESETTATEEPAAGSETVATEEPAADTESQTAATEVPPAEAASDATEAETTSETTAETTAEAESGAEAADDTTADTATLPAAETAADAENETASGETASGETAESETAEGEPAAATEDSGQTEADAATAESTAPADTAPAEVTQDDTAQTTAEANATVQTEAAAAAADNTIVEPSDADTVETITEETSRSSSEEFATAATAPAAEDRGGLSNFEKFALGALGVAAVATILNQNDKVVVSSDDRLVVQDDNGNYRVLKNDDELLRRPGVQVATREFSDGSTRTMVTREDGVRVVTIRAPDGQVLKRTRILPDGREIVLFDDTADIEPVEMSFLEQYRPRERTVDANDPDALRAALLALENPTNRAYSLQQIRQIRAVRELVPEFDMDSVNFDTGSAVIRPEEAADLSAIGRAIALAIDENPNEVFLIEGHTDATGGAAMNLALSDRRAESAALALTEYFDIPPENLVVQGYGESNLKIRTNEAERENRRVAVRRITPLLYAQR